MPNTSLESEVPKVVESLSPGFPDLTKAAGERVQGILQDEEVTPSRKGHGDTARKLSLDTAQKVENTMPRDTLLNSSDMHQHVSIYIYIPPIVFFLNKIFQGSA